MVKEFQVVTEQELKTAHQQNKLPISNNCKPLVNRLQKEEEKEKSNINVCGFSSKTLNASRLIPSNGYLLQPKKTGDNKYDLIKADYKKAGFSSISSYVLGNRKAIFIEKDGQLYWASGGGMHSHFFLRQGNTDVTMAGEIYINQGKITYISNKSGHYRPSNNRFRERVREYEKFGLLARNCEINQVGEEDKEEENKQTQSTTFVHDNTAQARKINFDSIWRFLTKHKIKLLIAFSIVLGFFAMGGLAAGFVFASPAIIALTLGVGAEIGIIIGAAILGSILFASLTTSTALLKKSDAIHLVLRTIIMSALLGGLAAGLLFGAAPMLGTLIISTLGLPMTIIALIVAPVLATLAASAIEYLLNFSSGKTSQSNFLATYSLLFGKILTYTLVPAALLGGLAAGLIFGAVPAVMGASLLIGGSLAGTIAVITLSALAIGFVGMVASLIFEKVMAKTQIDHAEPEITTEKSNENIWCFPTAPLKSHQPNKSWCPTLFGCIRSEEEQEEQPGCFSMLNCNK